MRASCTTKAVSSFCQHAFHRWARITERAFRGEWQMYETVYNHFLVVVSFLVAIVASDTALEMAARVSATRGVLRTGWLGGGAIAMGIGIWSTHFTGMLAFSLPVPIGYDVWLTCLSLLIAIAASACSLWFVCGARFSYRRLACGATVMGAGVAAMHYVGMGAMRLEPGVQYNLYLVALSGIIATGACAVAMWMAIRVKQQCRHPGLWRTGAAVLMGGAIAATHYTGMAAAGFPVGTRCAASALGKGSGWLTLSVIVSALAVMAIARITAVLNRLGEARTMKFTASLADAHEGLTYLAHHDPLTHLSNRDLLDEKLRHALRNAQEEQRCIATLFIDLDNFRTINDAFGYHAGDRALVQVAQRISKLFTASDTVSRFGGDELVVVAHIADSNQAEVFAQRILDAARQPIDMQGKQLQLSASVGIAVYPGDGVDPEELIRNAGAAMYHAKSSGRDRHCFFDASMNAHARDHLEMAQVLRCALIRQEFVLFYQPKVSASTGRMIGVEALLRWRHPTRGWMTPNEFLPLAEKSGLIVSLGTWVLNEGCRQLADWHERGRSDLTMAINLSALQFADAGLVGTVRAALARHGLRPGALTLEVTESVAMEDVDHSMRILQELREMGVSIAIDDFGTGYSSLLYLKRLPATELKIDCGFVRQLAHSAEDVAITSAIVALGKTLHLEIVAEGVENVEQKLFLAALGCDTLQGFLLGRPMPAAHLWAHLQSEAARGAPHHDLTGAGEFLEPADVIAAICP